MKARKCARCGKFYDDYKPTEETKNANALRLMGTTHTSAKNSGWYDLCEDCMKDLVTFLDTPPAAPEGPTGPSEGGEGTDTTPDPESPTGPFTGGVEGDGETDPTPGPTEPETPTEGPTEGEEGDGGGEGT